MLVLDALFDHIQQISSNVEIIGILIQRFGSRPVERPSYKFDGIACRPELDAKLSIASFIGIGSSPHQSITRLIASSTVAIICSIVFPALSAWRTGFCWLRHLLTPYECQSLLWPRLPIPQVELGRDLLHSPSLSGQFDGRGEAADPSRICRVPG